MTALESTDQQLAGEPPKQRDGFVQVRVAGAPYEMGLQHGELLKQEIHGLLDAVYHHVLYGQPGALGWGIRALVRGTTNLMATQIPPRYRREMAGIARAADVSYRDVLLVNCFDDVLANLRLLEGLAARLACSGFALEPERTTSRELLCGRNLDYFVTSAHGDDVWAATNYMKEHVAVIEHQPDGAASFASVGWPGFVGTATAMSDRGMVVSSLTVTTIRNRPIATPAPFLYRRIMEDTNTLEDAIRVLQHAPRTQGNNVLLGSGDEGKAAVVEFTPWRFAVRRPEGGWIATTNHFNHPSMLHHGGQVFGSSTDRLARLGELCDCQEPIPSEIGGAASFLIDAERPSAEANEYCSVWNPCTIYSTYFAPAKRRMWVRISDRPGRSFEDVRLAGWSAGD
ncbi:MAG: penicillin acylase-like amidase [Chloroflexi bacterium]|nr:penicillin acylase-like amidase [Chloroflexota bacterium]